MPDLAWTQNAARPRHDVGDIALTQRASHKDGDDRLVLTSKPQTIAVEPKTRGTSMDMTSIVTSHPALADGGAGLQGSRHLPRKSPPVRRAMKLAPSLAVIIHQSNPLDSAAQSYQGGAFVTLDFTPEVERPKAACSIGPTTT
jgi:hypothetical protein